jgi:hypothetical protein
MTLVAIARRPDDACRSAALSLGRFRSWVQMLCMKKVKFFSVGKWVILDFFPLSYFPLYSTVVYSWGPFRFFCWLQIFSFSLFFLTLLLFIDQTT